MNQQFAVLFFSFFSTLNLSPAGWAARCGMPPHPHGIH